MITHVAPPHNSDFDVVIKGTFSGDQTTGLGFFGLLMGMDFEDSNPLAHLMDKRVVAVIHFTDFSSPELTVWDQNQKSVLLSVPFSTAMDFNEENDFVATGNPTYTLLISKRDNSYIPSLLSYNKETHKLAHKWDIIPDNNDWVRTLAVQTHLGIKKLKDTESLLSRDDKWANRLANIESAFPGIEKSYKAGHKNEKPVIRKRVNTTPPKTTKFNSQYPEINIVRFVKSPFGLSTLDKNRISEEEFFAEMNYNLPRMKETASQYIEHYYDYGKASSIPLSYKGKDMNLAAVYFDENNDHPLRQYIYTFTFEKKKYQKSEVVQFANYILQDLNNSGITLRQDGSIISYMADFGEAKGKINNSDIIVSASEESTYDYEVRIIVTKPFVPRR